MSSDDYVLGTNDEEIARLGVQHRVWRTRAIDAWRRAGIAAGQTVVDVGCGPGYAALDLADLVGASGRVIAIDRSQRFLAALEAAANSRGVTNITTMEADLDAVILPDGADLVWCRWVAAFVSDPKRLLAKIHAALEPGGAFVSHEYFDYGQWRLAPETSELDEFVRAVIATWRDSGGEPNVGVEIPQWCAGLGFAVRETRPIMDVLSPREAAWQWPRAFVESGLHRLTELGHFTPARAGEIWRAFLAREAAPETLMVTPAVLETVAVKP
ncbi:MAG TPA: methyltransferase domain-containing protein [Vicinamibacterales bacterium]|nr:methyltransferase domain-containing protein [Vicinamibacterales bacterium]